MAETSIEWTDRSWNAVRGCLRVSAGCGDSTGGGCYAERMAHRFSGPGLAYDGLTRMTAFGPRWTGEARFIPEKLSEPLSWRKPQRVFVNSMSDLFHKDITNEQIAAIFGVMAAAPQHTFQVLTKRPERMLEWFKWIATAARGRADGTCIAAAERIIGRAISPSIPGWPLRNVHLGISVEDQAAADKRIPLLLQVPAAVRWLSCEPLLGPLDLDPLICQHCGGREVALADDNTPCCPECDGSEMCVGMWLDPLNDGIAWVVVGSEDGPKSRSMDEAWVRAIRDKCQERGVPFFYKQRLEGKKKVALPLLDGRSWAELPGQHSQTDNHETNEDRS